MQREKFGSRLGFILISAGCAIGLGNVYRFPIMTGAYGGGFFVLIYIAFLLLLGLPIMTAELTVGRASQRSIASSFDVLEKPGQKWHFMKYAGIAGNYLLMMFYTTISSWMFIYFGKYVKGDIIDVKGAEALKGVFGETVSNTPLIIAVTFFVIILCFAICSLGLQKGVERITKVMMILLFALMIGLAIYSCTLSGSANGLKFYFIPSLENLQKAGVWTVISGAMGQAFFSLSIGIGSIAIFGSYISKEKRLMGEAATIISLDTSVALISGLIVFPAYFTYIGNTAPTMNDAGAGFLFITLSSIFNSMAAPIGQIVGILFFLFMIFAALSTVIAVFENIMSFWLELTKFNRVKAAIINIVLMCILSLPAILGLNPAIFGGFDWHPDPNITKDIIDLEDFIISNNLLPLGSLCYVLFCTYNKHGWGWSNFMTEANTGKGLAFPKWMRLYVKYVLPLIILIVWAQGWITMF